ncbi:recombinase RecF [Thiopseudomonas alkaliphila]|uniref:AAA family ATPase n=1 Tax=Thiopseudomonas alkaliphila TaxID=1697053 RepID=UPI00069F2DEF|nr:AAA family ATPase [Thiopseudomonas alkaliphila]AKX54393.1 recombinase RecF [Thiopseudomonas alkaliphila]
MTTKKRISSITIKGFKSIRQLEDFRLQNLNVLIGGNGVGKSNFVDYFRMLSEMMAGRLQVWISKQGGADRILSYGIKETEQLESYVQFDRNGYKFVLEPSVNAGFVFTSEHITFAGDLSYNQQCLGSGHLESHLPGQAELSELYSRPGYSYNSIVNWKVFHFHDTSETAGVKRKRPVHDNEFLRPDASNLAAYLYRLSKEHPETLEEIRRHVQLGIPIFDDFVFRPEETPTEEQLINLQWRQKNSDYILWPSQLSDGSIRFICLVTALLQPEPPSTIIIDEPELGLHPYAITLLGALLRSASKRMQVIVSTQSVPLVNEFELEDLIVVDREQGDTVFKRLKHDDFSSWLEDYTVGELWQKNILGGRPSP